MATTFRADIATGIYNVLVTYAAANPTKLLRAFRARPSSIGPDLPCAWVDARPESVNFDAQTMTRTMTPSVVIAHAGGDNAETALALDQLIDGLVDAFALTGGQFATRTMTSRLSIADEQVQVGDYLFPSVRFSWPDITIMDGRP